MSTRIRVGSRVTINDPGGFEEFKGKAGKVIDKEMDASTQMFRVSFDEPVTLGDGTIVEDDLWAEDLLKLETPIASTNGGPKFRNIKVQLSGNDGNAFAVLAAVKKALRQAGVPKEEQEEFTAEAMSGDYDHLLQTAMAWVDVS